MNQEIIKADPAALTPQRIREPESRHEPEEASIPMEPLPSIPLDPEMVKAITKLFCRAPYNGDDKPLNCSVGVGDEGLVAHNDQRLILIGSLGAGGFTATERKEVLLECERAKLYGEAVSHRTLQPRVMMGTGETVAFPSFEELLARVGEMVSLGSFDPDALIAIGKVAKAAKAMTVSLFRPTSDENLLGFEFKFVPESNLFNQWEGPVTARGVFAVDKKAKPEEAEEAEEGAE